MRVTLMLTAVLFVSACETMATPTAQAEPKDPPSVSTARAVNLFNEVCTKSLPKFASAEKRMQSVGATFVASSGTAFSPNENVSFKILDGPDIRKTCSMTFVSPDNRSKAFAAFSERGEIITLSDRAEIVINNPDFGGAVILFLGPDIYQGKNFYNVKMLSES